MLAAAALEVAGRPGPLVYRPAAELAQSSIPVTALKVCPEKASAEGLKSYFACFGPEGSGLMVGAVAANANPSTLPATVDVGGTAPLRSTALTRVAGRAASNTAATFALYEKVALYTDKAEALGLEAPSYVINPKTNYIYAIPKSPQVIRAILRNQYGMFSPVIAEKYTQAMEKYQSNFTPALFQYFNGSFVQFKSPEELATFLSRFDVASEQQFNSLEEKPGFFVYKVAKKVERKDYPTAETMYKLYGRRPEGYDEIAVLKLNV